MDNLSRSYTLCFSTVLATNIERRQLKPVFVNAAHVQIAIQSCLKLGVSEVLFSTEILSFKNPRNQLLLRLFG